MNPIVDEAIDFIFERSRETKSVMVTLGQPPHNWTWTGVSSGNYENLIKAMDDQLVLLGDKEAVTSVAAAQWDHDISLLLADAVFGSSLARVKYKNNPVLLHLFEGLRHGGGGREVSYKQALEFEKSWKAADPSWVFQPGLTLAQFKLRREALRTREDAHVDAEKAEAVERAQFHVLANDVNEVAVDWYAVATATFGPNTVAGALVRTIPTTYNPAQPPGQLVFTAHMAVAPNQAHLLWRAPRGEKYFISGKGPNDAQFQLLLDDVTDKEWVGLGLASGLWQFQGYATNEFGQGPVSDVVSINVPAIAAA
jgi:hypothetical protein